MKKFEISMTILFRDKELYQKISNRITFEEKIALLDFNGSYRKYQRNLFKLARRYGIEILPARKG